MKTIEIKIPKGKEAYGIIAIPYDGYIQVCYKLKDKWEPKDGDFVSYTADNKHYLLIYKQQTAFRVDAYIILDTSSGIIYTYSILHNIASAIKPATEEQKQQLLDAMHKECKDWDAENKKIVRYRWKPKEGCGYYSITECNPIKVAKFIWNDDPIDNIFYNHYNCFRTEEEAETIRDRFQKVLDGAKMAGE